MAIPIIDHDIETLRKKMHDLSNKYGLLDRRVLEASQELDKLILIKQKDFWFHNKILPQGDVYSADRLGFKAEALKPKLPPARFAQYSRETGHYLTLLFPLMAGQPAPFKTLPHVRSALRKGVQLLPGQGSKYESERAESPKKGCDLKWLE